MPATPELYQEVFQKITQAGKLGKNPRRRLAWLTVGIIGARSCVTAAVARELHALGLTRAREVSSVERTVRRILQDERVHLFRVSLSYWGGALPLAWALWPQNQKQPAGTYWRKVDEVLARVAALLPRGVEVWIVADRAYDIPRSWIGSRPTAGIGWCAARLRAPCAAWTGGDARKRCTS